MPHERMPTDEFFALPDYNPDAEGAANSLGVAGLKEEGAPLYRDASGYYWSLQIGCKGSRWRAPA